PKPQTPNPKPQTPNPKPLLCYSWLLIRISKIMAASTVVFLGLLLSVSCIIRLPLSEAPLRQKEKGGKPVFSHAQSMIRQGIYDDEDRMYMMTKLELGADRHEIPLILDSGSSALWINKFDC